MTTRDTGNKAEWYVCSYLISHGYNIIKRNYTIKGGEIDIIASKDDIISFVEVKARRNDSIITAYEAINKGKMTRIIKTSEDFIIKNEILLQPRFDVAVVALVNGKMSEINYIENAFNKSDTNIIF